MNILTMINAERYTDEQILNFITSTRPYNKFGVTSHDYQSAVLDWTLSTNEQKCMLLKFTNSGGAVNIIAPNISGLVYVINNKTANNATIKKSGGTGVTIATNKTCLVMHNGTDYIKIFEEV